MERKLDDLRDQVTRLEVASEHRHAFMAWHLQAIHARLDQPQPSGWLKVPLALALPIAVFLLMLALTGDWRSAMHAAKLAG